MEINEDLVSLRLAKLAKDKGFNIPTVKAYSEKGEMVTSEDWNYSCEGGMSYENWFYDYNTYGYEEFIYSAPTLASLQKWLRVTFKLHIEILLTDEIPYNKFYFRVMKIGQYFTLSYTEDLLDTPEKALDTALIYALENYTEKK